MCSGNRFDVPDFKEDTRAFFFGTKLNTAVKAFAGITELRVDETLISWGQICNLANQFGDLSILDVSSNQLETTYDVMTSAALNGKIKSLKLEHNAFDRLSSLEPLAEVTSLKSLHLKGNSISMLAVRTRYPEFSENLEFVDLSYNKIDSWKFIESLQYVFPGMTSLRISNNPIMTPSRPSTRKAQSSASAVDENFMLVVARLPKLTFLNFSPISEADRTNAEMFYLSKIAAEMAAGPEAMQEAVAHGHRRYKDLCEIYGTPDITPEDHGDNPNYLESRLIKFAFYMPAGTKEGQEEDKVHSHNEIPKGWDTYRIKGYVGKMFEHRPLGLRLIWETGEWDPVAGYEDLLDDSDDEEVVESAAEKEGEDKDDKKGKYMQREVEIEDGTRQIGFLIDDKTARVRVEII